MNQSRQLAMMRRSVIKNQSLNGASRHYWQFIFPHSFTGTNNAYNNVPSKKDEISTDFHVGDSAPIAHNDVRVFPAWYKPYTFNYTSDGYMLLFFGGFFLYGYSYMNDIKEQKGRKVRKIFPSSLLTNTEGLAKRKFAKDRLAAHDPHFEKYTHKKERAAVHH